MQGPSLLLSLLHRPGDVAFDHILRSAPHYGFRLDHLEPRTDLVSQALQHRRRDGCRAKLQPSAFRVRVKVPPDANRFLLDSFPVDHVLNRPFPKGNTRPGRMRPPSPSSPLLSIRSIIASERDPGNVEMRRFKAPAPYYNHPDGTV